MAKLSLFYQIGRLTITESYILSTHSHLIKITNIKETITAFTEIYPNIEIQCPIEKTLSTA